MHDPTTTLPSPVTSDLGDSGGARDTMALIIACSTVEPHRVGEVALLAPDGKREILGRGAPPLDGSKRWTRFGRQRPGSFTETPPLAGAGISRSQLVFRAHPTEEVTLVERVGICATLLNGRPLEREGVLVPGDTLLLKGQLLLYCARRPRSMPALRHFPADQAGAFGEPDRHGMVGESLAAHRLREEIAFAAQLDDHVLVVGASGTGKELAARAVHGLSSRAGRPFVACSAATFPATLIEAELFGNARNYPGPGMAERGGLVGEAEGGTLFLDEIGELPHDLQARLLRLLDGDGEYHRLGETGTRRAKLRVVAATNRAPEALKHDLAARLKLRVALPDLNARREDVPLLMRQKLRAVAAKAPRIARGFLSEDGELLADPTVVEQLLRRPYTTNVRELERLLLDLMAGKPLDPAPQAPASAAPRPRRRRATPLEKESVIAGLERHEGNLTHTAQDLGTSRFALLRFVKKHGIKR